MDFSSERATILRRFSAGGNVLDELLDYNHNHFLAAAERLPEPFAGPLPMSPESHISAWRHYLDDAADIGVFASLQQRFAQLRFPIAKGISDSDAYRAATRRGIPAGQFPEASGLQLAVPETLELKLHDTLAGPIPVIIARHRGDFEALVQAFSRRNEPLEIPPSMGAAMIAGFNNWDRINTIRREWEKQFPEHAGNEAAWQQKFKEIIPQKHLYKDRFILLSDGPYSAVPAGDVGLPEATWRSASLVIRREHECAHYFTRRVYGSMKNNLLDELIADYMGITAANGRYRADWFLRFMGLEGYPDYRPGGRIENYPGTPPLSPPAFKIIQQLLVNAAGNIEQFEAQLFENSDFRQHPHNIRNTMLLILTQLTLELLASDNAEGYMRSALGSIQERFPEASLETTALPE